jgi:fluoride ion exporter CrcB/FEX
MDTADYIVAAISGGALGALLVFVLRPGNSARYLAFAICGAIAAPLISLLGVKTTWQPLTTFINFLVEHQEYLLAALTGGLFGAFFRWVNGLNRPQTAQPTIARRVYVAVGMGVGIVCILLTTRFNVPAPSWDWILVFVLGGLVGIGELASRYRDDPVKALFCIPAVIYIFLNAGAATLALVLGRSFWWTDTPQSPVAWSQVITAGLGAMVLLRSSVFRVKVGDQDVAIGPSSFLQSVIDSADRAVDRIRAQERAWTVSTIMERVDPLKLLQLLPQVLPALMQNMSDEDKKKFEQEASVISNLPPQVQALRMAFS